jgi:hypothetical protein
MPHDAYYPGRAPMADGERLANWILTVKEGLRKYTVDRDHLSGGHLICRREKSAPQQWNSHGF